MALKALVEYDLKFADAQGKAHVELVINKDTKNAIKIDFDSSTQNAIEFPPFQNLLIEGKKKKKNF